jgi:dihydrodipicolinate reductase
MPDASIRRGVYATVAHRKLSGQVVTVSFDVESPAAALENVALLLQTVIRLMTGTTGRFAS